MTVYTVINEQKIMSLFTSPDTLFDYALNVIRPGLLSQIRRSLTVGRIKPSFRTSNLGSGNLEYVLPRVCRNEVIACSRQKLRNLIHNHYILSPLSIPVRLARVERVYTQTTRTNKESRYICCTGRKRFSPGRRVLKYVGKGGGCGPEM